MDALSKRHRVGSSGDSKCEDNAKLDKKPCGKTKREEMYVEIDKVDSSL